MNGVQKGLCKSQLFFHEGGFLTRGSTWASGMLITFIDYQCVYMNVFLHRNPHGFHGSLKEIPLPTKD